MEHLSVSLHHSYWFDLCDSHINIKKINTHYLNPGEENISSRTTLNVHSLQRFSPKGCNSAEMCSSQHLLCFRGKKIYMASNRGHKLSEQRDAKVFLTNFTEAKTRLCSFWRSGRGVVTTVVCYFKIESISWKTSGNIAVIWMLNQHWH